ncbi:MAG: PspA/IM30 family protein [Microthrixaceae bacterium]
MFKTLKKWWSYLSTKLNMSFNEAADPRVQLEQAITEAQEQHRRLTEQATAVIANQKTTEIQLERKMAELEKLNANARQAVLMADEQAKAGNAAKATEYTSAAEAFANRLIALEKEVDGLKTMALQAAKASDQAKAAVQQNSSMLQQKLAEKQKLLSQLDQAKMQERMNSAMRQITATVGEDVPTFEEIRTKIEDRQAKASASAELQGGTVEAKMIEVEQASINVEAQSRLEEIRSQLGLSTASAPTAESTATSGTPTEAPDTAPATEPGTGSA